MTPAERAALCGSCQLPQCDEQSPVCLIKINRLERKVNRASVGVSAVLRTNAAERQRANTVHRAIFELATMKQMSPDTVREMLAPYVADKEHAREDAGNS